MGYGPEVAAAYAPWTAAADAAPGRVLCAGPGLVRVLAEDGPRRASLGAGLLAALATEPGCAPWAGDWVVLRAWPDNRWTVEAVLPRRTTVPVPGQGEGRSCANVDVLVVLGGNQTDRTAPAAVEVLRTDGRDVAILEERLTAGRTLAVTGGEPRTRAALLRRLAGGDLLVLRDAGPCLLPVPGGGALVDLAGDPGLGLGGTGWRRAR